MEERFGPWHLDRRLASGGLADVTVARRADDDVGERIDDREIALKRLHAHQARDPDVIALFDAEVSLTRDIQPHPRLVRGLDSGDVDGRPWLALGLVDGGDLRRRLDAGEHPSPAAAIAIVVDTADALAHLHAHGWLHGDVNPSNLIVDAGRATLCDLGVARPIGAGGPVRGTHAYMAPEQVRGEPWTRATDVFALGTILWELLAGERLFFRGATYLSMAAVIDVAPTPLADPDLDALARRALAKDAAARLSSADELADALRAVAAARAWTLPG